ncbi:hypothetical protein VTO42DRAFT_8002 [Malbranchea cinnamomea]
MMATGTGLKKKPQPVFVFPCGSRQCCYQHRISRGEERSMDALVFNFSRTAPSVLVEGLADSGGNGGEGEADEGDEGKEPGAPRSRCPPRRRLNNPEATWTQATTYISIHHHPRHAPDAPGSLRRRPVCVQKPLASALWSGSLRYSSASILGMDRIGTLRSLILFLVRVRRTGTRGRKGGRGGERSERAYDHPS